MSDFPPVGMIDKEDSAKYSIQQKDNTVKSKVEGGYVFTRPRSTRAPRKVFETGFTQISNDDKKLLESFYEGQKGGALAFTWSDPVDAIEYSVRFDGDISFKYAGRGGLHRWDVKIKMEQV